MYLLFFSFQRTRLLDNTERLERTGKHLEEGYKMCVETGECIHWSAIVYVHYFAR